MELRQSIFLGDPKRFVHVNYGHSSSLSGT